ncbi:MAG: hypothetical protein HQL69_22135 [Magnetococcales bacterium]|nr:hypothetical protein [Magnetococcales bacterium]
MDRKKTQSGNYTWDSIVFIFIFFSAISLSFSEVFASTASCLSNPNALCVSDLAVNDLRKEPNSLGLVEVYSIIALLKFELGHTKQAELLFKEAEQIANALDQEISRNIAHGHILINKYKAGLVLRPVEESLELLNFSPEDVYDVVVGAYTGRWAKSKEYKIAVDVFYLAAKDHDPRHLEHVLDYIDHNGAGAGFDVVSELYKNKINRCHIQLDFLLVREYVELGRLTKSINLLTKLKNKYEDCEIMEQHRFNYEFRSALLVAKLMLSRNRKAEAKIIIDKYWEEYKEHKYGLRDGVISRLTLLTFLETFLLYDKQLFTKATNLAIEQILKNKNDYSYYLNAVQIVRFLAKNNKVSKAFNIAMLFENPGKKIVLMSAILSSTYPLNSEASESARIEIEKLLKYEKSIDKKNLYYSYAILLLTGSGESDVSINIIKKMHPDLVRVLSLYLLSKHFFVTTHRQQN